MLKFLCLSAIIAFVSASDVIELTDDDFDNRIADYSVALVEFFAPWCGHCKRLAPEYEIAATSLKENEDPVALVKVDCTVSTKVCGKHGVSGYPTLKIFRGGNFDSDYNGPRDAPGITKTMKSKAGPSSKELKSIEDIEKFLQHADHGIVGFFDKEDSDISKQFTSAASSLSENYRFAHTFRDDILDKYSYKDDIVIFQPKRLQSKFEPATLKYDGEAVIDKIKTWINDNIQGLCGHRTTGNADKFGKPLVVVYYDVDYKKNTKGTNYWRNRVMKVAKDHKSTTFSISARDDFAQELTEFGMDSKDDDKPVVAARDGQDKKYIMTEEFSVKTLEAFVEKFENGKLEPYMKSEALPDDNTGPVKVLVAKNFDEIVNDESKDVLIEFYAPWCGHCKTLAPKYDELAEKLKDESEIVIAKMDATANDVPSAYQVQGFPTLFFAPQGSKSSPKQYNGGREVNDFIEYLAKESTNPLKGYDRKGKEKKKTEL